MSRDRQTHLFDKSRPANPLARWLGIAFALAVLGAVPAEAQTLSGTPADSREYRIKAAFLYNFTRFIQWPEEAFPTGDAPLVIGILRRNPFGDELHEGVRDRQANNRNLQIRKLESEEGIGEINLLFVPAGEEREMASRIPALHQEGILTVGETDAFEESGGIITFTIEADRVRFIINRDAAREAGLRVSAQLLELALNRD